MNKEENIKVFLNLMGENLRTNNINYKIIQDDESLNINQLKIGLISGFCVWSGYTFGIGKGVLNNLSAEMVKNEIPLYLLDCDFISVELQKMLFNTNSWGYFESCWVENGEILKRYKYKYELDPFLFFVTNRLKEISGYFEDKIIKSYTLNSEKRNFGIENKDFISQKKAIILAKSKYKNQFLYDLMAYQEEGKYYLFEDDEIIIYDAITPTHLSSCFIKIKDRKKKAAPNNP